MPVFYAIVRLLFGLSVPVTLVAAPVDGCNGPDQVTVLRRSSVEPPARAVWLDDGRLQWPGVQLAAGERLRLLHSAEGSMALVESEPAKGFDAAFTLAETVAVPSDARFSYLAAGGRVGLREEDRHRLHSMR